MAIKSSNISNAALTTGNSTAWDIFAVPNEEGLTQAVTTMVFCNSVLYNPAATPEAIQADTDQLTVYLVPSSDNVNDAFASAGDAVRNKNLIINVLDIPPGETFTFESEKIILNAGDSIKAKCSKGYLVCTVSSLDLT
jgi:hypothetical protein